MKFVISSRAGIVSGLLAFQCAIGSGCTAPEIPPKSINPSSSPLGSLVAMPATPRVSGSPLAQETRLVLRAGEEKRSFSREDLLRHPSLETITIVDHAAYDGRSLTFEAISLWALFDGLPVADDEALEYDTLDGFSSSLPATLALNREPSKSVAYLAVERPGKPWPTLGGGEGTAGPFYVVWLNAEASSVGREQWPFQVKSFISKPALEKRFPKILPSKDLSADDPARRGFQVFVKNCFACHTLNDQGTTRMGPDLNMPHGPTEYMKEEYFRILVRDPQRLRTWKASKMTGFPESILSNTELDELWLYLSHMSETRTNDSSL